jgi:hypothetical protein
VVQQHHRGAVSQLQQLAQQLLKPAAGGRVKRLIFWLVVGELDYYQVGLRRHHLLRTRSEHTAAGSPDAFVVELVLPVEGEEGEMRVAGKHRQ